MKPINVTHSVMQRIARYESGQIVSWKRKYFSILFALLCGIGIVCVVVWKNLIDFGSLDLLSLLQEDQEVIHTYWKEIVETIWQELPDTYIFIGTAFIIAVLCIVIITRSRRRIIQKKETNIAKYKGKF